MSAVQANAEHDDANNILDIFHNKNGITVGDKMGPEEIINLPSRNGNYDAGFVCSVHDMTYLEEDVHIIRIEPHVTTFGEYGGIVHHMDLFACQTSPSEEFHGLDPMDQKEWCGVDEFLESSCRQIMWAYDKGADAFDFPESMGMLLGPSSGIDSILMQIHYLLPEDYESDGLGFHDASFFRLFTEPVQRPHDVGMFGFLDAKNLDIPPGRESFEFRVHLAPSQLYNMIAADIQEHGKIYPIAAHLHGHDHLIGARLEHYRDNALIGTYGDITPFHGYGHDQTFLTLINSTAESNVEPILEGDSLTFVCTYDSSLETNHIYYGVSYGDEMCAPLLLYYPKGRGKGARMTENVAVIDREESGKNYKGLIDGIKGEE